MVTLRATKKVLRWLPPVSAGDHSEDTALGDWYVNRFVVDRLPDLVGQRLRRLGVADPLVEREVAAMQPVGVAPTRDRSVVGTLVDFERTVPYCVAENGWSEIDLRLAEMQLAEAPCRVSSPGRKTGT